MSILEEDYDVICLTETWTTTDHNTEEFIPPTYNVFRRDRFLHSNHRGGGVLIAVSKDVFAEQILIAEYNLEILVIRCRTKELSFILINIYIPSNSPASTYQEFSQILYDIIAPLISSEVHLVIMGDFNLPNVDWHVVDGEIVPANSNGFSNLAMDSIYSLGTKQCNQTRNTHGSLLDLVFTSSDLQSSISSCDDLGNASSIYHTPLRIEIFYDILNCNFNVESSENESFNFRSGDYDSLNASFDSTDWSFLSTDNCLDSVVDKFYDVLNAGKEEYVPRRKSTGLYREPWYNARLINIKNRKCKAHKVYKRFPTEENFQCFRSLRSEFKILNRFLYESHVLEIESDIKQNPRKFWNFVDSRKHCKGYPDHMHYNSHTSNDPLEISNFFASFFKSVYNDACVNETIELIQNTVNTNFHGFVLSEADVFSALMEIDVNMGQGPDGIPNIFIKRCAMSLVQPLTILFNRSLSTQYFPLKWKLSFVKPIYKSGSRLDILNYRGIAILSAIPKVFEKIITKYLFFDTKNFITTKQHGFFSGRSTITNLSIFTNFVSLALESKKQVQVVYTDFSKAFDKVDHFKLILKLNNLPCPSTLPVAWILSYLSDRYQCVAFKDKYSSQFKVTSGVPQGSHLGPLLFILFINDVLSCLKFSECLLYADDLKIFKSISTDSDEQDFQSDLSSFYMWCQSNNLLLNVAKCKSMCFSRRNANIPGMFYLGNSQIPNVDSFLDLGVLFSNTLSFSSHIEKCISKAFSMLGFVKRFAKDFHDPYTLKTLYCSYVRPHLEYASIIWNPYYNNASDRIESVQKRFLIYALRRLPRDETVPRYILPSYHSRCMLLSIDSLSTRRLVACALFIRDLLTCRIDCPDILRLLSIYIPVRRLRSRDFSLRLEPRWTNYGRSEPVFSASEIFNRTVETFDFNMSREVFRRHVLEQVFNI